MLLDQLERGKRIQTELQSLREHLRLVAPERKRNLSPLRISYSGNTYRDEVILYNDFYDINEFLLLYRDEVILYNDFYDINEFLLLYRAKIEKRILALMGEFASL